jgi:hypothetical protein
VEKAAHDIPGVVVPETIEGDREVEEVSSLLPLVERPQLRSREFRENERRDLGAHREPRARHRKTRSCSTCSSSA